MKGTTEKSTKELVQVPTIRQPKQIPPVQTLTTGNKNHWFNFLIQEFEKESDRACVVLAASLLDSALETVLSTYLVPVATGPDTLLDGATAPVGTFSAKIDLAYRTGLISSRFARDLHLIRRIRNDFAHNISSCSFEDASVRSRALELARSAEKSLNPNHRIVFPVGPKGDFELSVSWMQWHLRNLSETLIPMRQVNPEWGYNPGEEAPEL